MGVVQKHTYRTVFLKSDDWKDVRIAALCRDKSKCRVCGFESFHNDGHHVFYPKSIWDTTENDIIILCRDCHNLVHSISSITKDQSKKDRDSKFRDLRVFLDCLHDWKLALDKRGCTVKKLKRKSNRYESLKEKKNHKIRCVACSRNNVDLITKEIKQNPKNPESGLVSLIWCNQCWDEFCKSDQSDWKKVRSFFASRKMIHMVG